MTNRRLKRHKDARKTPDLAQPPCSPKELSPGNGTSAPENPARGRCRRADRRIWTWRLIAAVGVTSLVIALMEMGLRAAGYGFSPEFFLPSQVQGRAAFVNNPQYGWRFFPPALARECWPFSLPAHKAPDTLRVFVFGESAAMGDPDPRFGLSRMLEALLVQRYPERRIEVVNVAFTAINSHVILPIARECARREGDLWVIYMGNNEVAGPFGPATVFGSRSPPLPVTRANIALRTTRLGQLLDSLLSRARGETSAPEQWRGMEMVLGTQMHPSDPRLEVVYANYRKNLQDLLQVGRRSGARIVLCTMGTNLRDCAPFASLHPSSQTESQVATWETAYQTGIARREQDDLTGALAAFQQALQLDDQHADLHFRLAGCLEALGQVEAAAEHYRQARDADALRFRADTRLNRIVQEVGQAVAGPWLRVFDAEDYLAQHTPGGLPGAELFFEHVHLTPTGNYLLARGIAEQGVALLAFDPSSTDGQPPGTSIAPSPEPPTDLDAPRAWASEADCRLWLGLTDRNLYSLYGRVLRQMMNPPFRQQSTQAAQVRRLGAQQAGLRHSTEAPEIARMAGELRGLVTQRPHDGDLRSNYASMLALGGDLTGAEQEWREVIALLPHAVQAWVGLGMALESLGRPEDAARCYQECLRLSPLHPQGRARLEGLIPR